MKTIQIIPLQHPISTEVTIPGSKSYTNRALLLAVMCKNPVKIINPLISNDTNAMIQCLRTLGIKIETLDGSVRVTGSIDNIKDGQYDLDANLSGTTIRFLLALSTIIPGVKTLFGKKGLNKRPIGELVKGLRQLGAKIEYLQRQGHPPIRVLSSKLSPGTIKMSGEVSSQYISSILMITPLVGKTTIKVIGDQISKPYIDMTIDTMKKFGVGVSNESYKKYTIGSDQKYYTKQYIVEGDVSSASYFAAIAALTKSTITLKNLNPKSKQADMRFLEILANMGNKIIYKKNSITIHGKGVKSTNVNMSNCPDQIQTLAVLASFANGITKISGFQSLRIKETDRVFALETELNKMGIQKSTTIDSLIIHGGNPMPAKIDTYNDHRMAMAFAVAGTKLSGMQIKNPDVVNKTFPDFWKKLNEIDIKSEMSSRPIRQQAERGGISKNIILIGMRGSGKTTTAKLLSKRLNKEFIELDELMVKKAGMSIPKIVEKYGWSHFRDRESEIAQEVSLYHDKVISTGGGVVIRQKNIDNLRKNSIIIWLRASPKILLNRMGSDPNRPRLTDKKTLKEEIEELLKQREKLYQKAADVTTDTENLKPEEVLNQILLKVKRYGI